MRNVVIQSLDKIEKFLKYTVVISLFVMTIVTFSQIVLRYVFKAPTIWSEEVARYLYIWLVLLASAVAVRSNRHIRIDFLVNKFKPKTKFVIETIGLVLILIFLVVLLREGISIVQGTTNAKSQGIGIKMSYAYLAIPAGASLMILFTIEMMVKHVKSFLIGQKEGE
ncbi:TRAP transporter small permease [bacterium LRH843]|nr:TRAP transporter small permease [bacterium LRH843]